MKMFQFRSLSRRMQNQLRAKEETRELCGANAFQSVAECPWLSDALIVPGFGAVEADRYMQSLRGLKFVNATPQQESGGWQEDVTASSREDVHYARSFRQVQRLTSTDPNNRRFRAVAIAAGGEIQDQRMFVFQAQGTRSEAEGKVRGQP